LYEYFAFDVIIGPEFHFFSSYTFLGPTVFLYLNPYLLLLGNCLGRKWGKLLVNGVALLFYFFISLSGNPFFFIIIIIIIIIIKLDQWEGLLPGKLASKEGREKAEPNEVGFL